MGQIFQVRVRAAGNGFVATCDAPTCMSRATTRDEVLEKIRAEIRYRIELCPCTGVADDFVQLDVQST
jgi:hypothetical protein